MLSQHQLSLGIGSDPGIAAASHSLAALPSSICSVLRHHLAVFTPPGSPNYSRQNTRETLRDYEDSYPQKRSFLQTARRVGGTTIMHSIPSSTPPASHNARLPLRLNDTTSSVLTFQAPPRPPMGLTFPSAKSPPESRKRCRALGDIDGEHSCIYKKKRRLRLFLITSRLSPEFSLPATNIVDRGNSKIAVWAKQKALGRNLLRKAAILNRIRLRAVAARGSEEGLARTPVEEQKEQKQLELARLAFIYGSHDPHIRPNLHMVPSFPPATTFKIEAQPHRPPHSSMKSPVSILTSLAPTYTDAAENMSYRSPNDAYAGSHNRSLSQASRKPQSLLPPSPLGLSNYDAFDDDEDIPDPYSHLDDEDDGLHEQDDVPNYSLSAGTVALQPSALSTVTNTITEIVETPAPQTFYSDFSVLDPGEPLIGDHDQINEGFWPNMLAPGPLPSSVKDSTPLATSSCSPNFSAIFAASRY